MGLVLFLGGILALACIIVILIFKNNKDIHEEHSIDDNWHKWNDED